MLSAAKFANRSIEFAAFRKFAASRAPNKRLMLFRAPKSSGASEFLRYIAGNQDRSAVAVYADMAAGGVPQLVEALKEARDQRFLCRLGNFLQSAPLVGLLSRIALLSTAPLSLLARMGATALVGIGEGILVAPFPSTAASRICRMAVTWPKPDIYFYLDNAQKKATEILQIMHACASDQHYGHVRFVLAITDETDGDIPYESFLKRFPFRPSVLEEEKFRPIDAQFVAAISETRGLELQIDDCERLAELAENDMWALLSYMDGRSEATGVDDLDPMSTFLIRLLCAADQPLRVSDMRLLVLRSDQIVGSPSEFDASIKELHRLRLIERTVAEDRETLVALTTRSALPIRKITDKDVANLAVTRDLYEFFSEAERSRSSRHSDSALAQLLYRLAHDIDPASVPARAQTLVRIAMSQGSVADAERYIEVAQRRTEMPSLHDLFVQIALFVSLQEYARAKEILDRIPGREFDRYRVLRVLDAVALNRTREHAESDRKIDQLLEEGGSAEEQALLVSYKIGGLLHEERSEMASKVLAEWAPRIQQAKNYSYFLRNAAAVHMFSSAPNLGAAERMLDEAIHKFSAEYDAFGEATALCNLGVVKAYGGDIKSAERHFRRSYDRLSILGTQHIEESGTNIGTALMLLGEFDEAQRHIIKLLPMMEMDYPRAITEANLAMLEMLSGRKAAAVERMRELVAAAGRINIIDCGRHVRFAAALIESIAGNSARAANLLDAAERQGGSTKELAAIRLVVSSGPLAPDDAFSLYPKDWMQYWSQNPLQMLPVATLTPQAEFHYVA